MRSSSKNKNAAVRDATADTGKQLLVAQSVERKVTTIKDLYSCFPSEYNQKKSGFAQSNRKDQQRNEDFKDKTTIAMVMEVTKLEDLNQLVKYYSNKKKFKLIPMPK